MICIIQARINSKRLKKKLLKKINNHKIVEWVLIRASKIKKINKIILAVPKGVSSKPLIKFAKKYNCDYYEGSDKNLLKRFIDVLKNNEEHFIRICADNPFICPLEIDRLISSYKKIDYIYNHRPINNSYPDGLGGEISNLKILEKINSKKTSQSQKEHIFNYIIENKKKFKISTLEPGTSFLKKPFLKLDIDYKHQLEFFNKVKISPYMSTERIIKKIISK